MKVLRKKTMRGPNYWSNYWHNIIVATLDIGELEGKPTNKIEGFPARLEKMIPTMFSHQCSEKHEGGFFERVREGTWMAHVIEHIILELQFMAGMECGFGRTRSAGKKGLYTVAFEYEIPEAGDYALDAAIRIADAIINDRPYDINADIQKLKHIKSRKGLGVSTLAIIEEAKKRHIPFRRINNDSFIILGYGKNQRRIKASMTCATSVIGVDTACDKDQTKRQLEMGHIPVPQGEVVFDEEELKETIAFLGFPIVIKPIDGNQGKGITTNITTEEQAIAALANAKKFSERVIAERYVDGKDYRLLLVNHKLIAAAQRTPAMVVGDGRSSIQQLIDHENKDARRGEGHEKVLTTIKVDQITSDILTARGFTLDSILPIGEILFLKDTANLSTGGTSTDVTDLVHPDNIFMAERISRMVNLDVCGIDVIAQDIEKPITAETGAIIEVNACPGLRMHLSPFKGLPRNVAAPIVEMLFPDGKTSRIPIIAVTGTNGKTTTTRLTTHIAKTAGKIVGYTTTDGIYIDGRQIVKGDCTGYASTETILTDPMVDFAVLECARGGILRTGLGFDACDISIVTNVSEDHLGLDDIETLREMARVKSVVAESTAHNGYSILNAEDDLVYYMGDYLNCNTALFAMDPENERIKYHCRNDGLAAVIENDYLTICKGKWKTRICKVSEIPLTFSGKAECMIKNILPAVLAATIQNFSVEVIRKALMTFVPSPELTPGRFNIFNFGDFNIMVDYAHNQGGMRELKKFLAGTEATKKIGIVTAAGDRRTEDIKQMGIIAAEIFDEIIIRHDKDMRGRTREEMSALLIEGIHSVNPQLPVAVISDEHEALRHAASVAQPGNFITSLTESVCETIDFIRELKNEIESGAGQEKLNGKEKLNGHHTDKTIENGIRHHHKLKAEKV
jgi:cyanophycin synthetase